MLLADDAAGQAKFSTDEILAFLPLLMKSAGLTLESSGSSRALFDRVGQIVGATAQDSDEALSEKLRGYYRAHPPSPELQQAFAAFAKEEAGVVSADAFESFANEARLHPASPHVASARPVFDVREQDPSKEPK